jgi:hypothetical protein
MCTQFSSASSASHMNARATLPNCRTVKEDGGETLCIHFCIAIQLIQLMLFVYNRLGVFENRMLSRLFGPKKEVIGVWRRLHMRNFITCTVRQV